MVDFKGTTGNEDRIFSAIQKKLGIPQNCWIGCQTMISIADEIDADCFPCTVKIYGKPMIVCKDIIPFSPLSGVNKFKNCISGSFSDGISKPVSILINNGDILREVSCHFWDRIGGINGFPESVLFKEKSGKFGIKRVKAINELPEVKWAIGGMGLLENYDPKSEGFVNQFSDVLRITNHTVVGTKGNLIYLMYLENMSAYQINEFCKRKMCLDYAILLDGGHYAAINGDESFAKKNTNQKQIYAIQAI